LVEAWLKLKEKCTTRHEILLKIADKDTDINRLRDGVVAVAAQKQITITIHAGGYRKFIFQ
jgi:hypothetical protein